MYQINIAIWSICTTLSGALKENHERKSWSLFRQGFMRQHKKNISQANLFKSLLFMRKQNLIQKCFNWSGDADYFKSLKLKRCCHLRLLRAVFNLRAKFIQVSYSPPLSKAILSCAGEMKGTPGNSSKSDSTLKL